MGSWVEGADGSGFGLENLPYGVVSRGGGPARPAVRIGDRALILEPLAESGLLGDLPPGVFAGPVLNPFLALGRPAWGATRASLTELLREGSPEQEAAAAALVPLGEVEALLPVAIGDYVDFYSSIEHASNVGRIFRPDAEPLLPNWRHLPVGYHGRASSVVVSGTDVRRPQGQLPPPGPGGAPRFGPSERLDIELELGFVTGPGNALGTSIPTGAARDHIFGFVLVNDWSARDIQRWEYVPLGPFLGKSFATSVSPWIVPLEALEPHRVAAPPQDPEPLPYLRTDEDWALDIALEVALAPDGGEETVVSRTNASLLYWTAPQQLAHATVNGTNVRPGDLYASGTISGAERDSRGSLLELSWGGREAVELAGGVTRSFLEDGDTVVLRGSAGPISLGEVRGRILPAV
ncbi:MAG TPA: fumarylacetoacetase [Solirubrobacteraceae bacterium]|nr:fumarylacetoacetase [Solirubrobacteraceae bacterium]